jgi:hypothetical protein
LQPALSSVVENSILKTLCQIDTLAKMSSEPLAAVRSDDLPTIAEALVQSLIAERGISIVETIPDHPRVVRSATTALGSFLLDLASGPAEQISKDRVWQLLDCCRIDYIYSP